MRHLFVTTWLIARDFQKYGCYLAAPKANKANETTQRKTHESKQKQTKENRSTQQQPTAKQMLSCRTRENNKRKHIKACWNKPQETNGRNQNEHATDHNKQKQTMPHRSKQW